MKTNSSHDLNNMENDDVRIFVDEYEPGTTQ